MEKEKNLSSFSMGNSGQEGGLPYVPADCFGTLSLYQNETVPVIDLARLRQGDEQRVLVIKDIRDACSKMGFFQIVNHGIPQHVLDEALSLAFEFFELPTEEKTKFMSADVYKPVRYGTILKNEVGKTKFWRLFLKHYAHPLNDWIHLWPGNLPYYREKMGKYCTEVMKLALELMEIITESLGIGSKYLGNKLEKGMQVVAVNGYPAPCPYPEIELGAPPHSDHTCLTIVLQSSPGLQILVKNADDHREPSWKPVPEIHGALQVHVGDHLEVLSNGIYKSVVHRAVLDKEKTRVSIASLHSLGMDEKMETANELVDEEHPKGYKESSFRDFLNFLTSNDFANGKSFIDSLKINID